MEARKTAPKPATTATSTSSSPLPSPSAAAPDVKSPTARPLYSSKLGDSKTRVAETKNQSPSPRQASIPQPKAWNNSKNPITGRPPSTSPVNIGPQSKQSVTATFKEGQRVHIALSSGAEYEGIYASGQPDSPTFVLKMVQQRKAAAETNGTSKREQTTMSFQRRDVVDGRPATGNAGQPQGKAQNGTRGGFRTDTAISNNRPTRERELTRWTPDGPADGGLESTNNRMSLGGKIGAWDQFSANEKQFGLKTDYDENIYTTAINKNHPEYAKRMANADRIAHTIERSAPSNAHIAEERTMDFAGGNDQGGDEEDKYSGVRRQQDFPPLSKTENRYMPPAKRPPTGQATVTGAPVDPAIISSQIKGAGPRKGPSAAKQSEPVQPVKDAPATPAAESAKPPVTDSGKAEKPAETKPAESKAAEPKAVESKAAESKVAESKPAESKAAQPKAPDAKLEDKGSPAAAPTSGAPTPQAGNLRASATTSRTLSPQDNKDAAANAPSATSTVEADVLKSFKTFAHQQRAQADKVRNNKLKQDTQIKLQELKKFADSFKLSTPVPTDLISIIAKDPVKQKQIQEKAIQNAEETARKKKTDTVPKDKETPAAPVPKDVPAKPAAAQPQGPAAGPASSDTRGNGRANNAQQHNSSAAPNRHAGGRQPYNSQGYHQQPYRNERSPAHMQQNRTGNLAERLRRVDQERFARNSGQPHVPEMRTPSGPSGNGDNYARRMNQLPQQAAQLAAANKLNPNSHEFRPAASPFSPAGPSGGSSPRSAAVNSIDSRPISAPQPGQLMRRKTKAIDVNKCMVLSHIKALPTPEGKNWADNDGMRPAFDTPPVWRSRQDREPPNSTMSLTYKEYFEQNVYNAAAFPTPNPTHAVPQPAHQHQLPFHLQAGAAGNFRGGNGQTPHMPPMQMHGVQQHGNVHPVPSFGGPDDHRMMQSHSSQSYASPRMTQAQMYGPPQMHNPAQMGYNQQMMPQQPYMPSTPQMNQYRSFSNTPPYAQHNASMGVPMVPGPHFVPGPNGMMPSPAQMPMYPAGPQFVPGGAPPQPMPGSNGYPSPARPAAPMMAQQGSQQGQVMYGVSPSPNMAYQQPAFHPQQHGHMPMRGFSNPGTQQYGTSPGHQYGPRNGHNGYGGNKYQGHVPHQGPQGGHSVPSGPQNRGPERPEETK